jgi:hypothetical protein
MEDAARAYDAAAREVFGEFACPTEAGGRGYAWKKAAHRDNKTGLRGVRFQRGKFTSTFQRRHLGMYTRAEDAATAYNLTAWLALGEAATLNFAEQLDEKFIEQLRAEHGPK